MPPRKVANMSRWKMGGHRRSPRISALEACKPQQRSRLKNDMAAVDRGIHPLSPTERLAGHTRGRKRPKLKPLEDVAAKPVETGEEDSHEHDSSHSDQQTNLPSTSCLPDKRILELILDILQRRDTHEIFAEPVDPKEVEGYYEIIKQPMDFGTMRAKLHEGMYSSLEQFEHDVFLISRNAMEFNSSATIYFRQARAIHELAKRVFHSLKSDPEGFESEILQTRRKSGRRFHGDARGSSNNSSSKIPENRKSSGATIDESSKALLYSDGISSNQWKGVAETNAPKIYNFFSGGGNGRSNSSPEMDRYSTYRPRTSFLCEDASVISMLYNESKQLMHVNWNGIDYNESLMHFTKDLGPTAQKIAERKLSGWSGNTSPYPVVVRNYLSQAQKCQDATTSTSMQLRTNTMDTTTTASMAHDLADAFYMLENTCPDGSLSEADSGTGTCAGGSLGSSSAEVAAAFDVKRTASEFIDTNSSANRMHWNGASQLGFASWASGARALKVLDGFQNAANTSTRLMQDQSKSDDVTLLAKSCSNQGHLTNLLSGSRLRNGSSSLWPVPTSDQAKGLPSSSSWCQNASHEDSSTPCEAGQTSRSSQPFPPVSTFTFDLPFLKTRLDQMNSPGQNGFASQSSGIEDGFPGKTVGQKRLTTNHKQGLSIQP